jgi:hypothetical protein
MEAWRPLNICGATSGGKPPRCADFEPPRVIVVYPDRADWSLAKYQSQPRICIATAIEQEPNHAGCLTMLAIVYANGYLLHYDAEDKQEDLALVYAPRAHAEHVLEGLRKAALEIPGNPPVDEAAVTSQRGQARCRPIRARRNVRLVNRSRSPRLATSRSGHG